MAGKLYKNRLGLDRAWHEGVVAAAAGALIGTNPHIANSPNSLAWIDGFNGTWA